MIFLSLNWEVGPQKFLGNQKLRLKLQKVENPSVLLVYFYCLGLNRISSYTTEPLGRLFLKTIKSRFFHTHTFFEYFSLFYWLLLFFCINTNMVDKSHNKSESANCALCWDNSVHFQDLVLSAVIPACGAVGRIPPIFKTTSLAASLILSFPSFECCRLI